jgi:hypothetical protein
LIEFFRAKSERVLEVDASRDKPEVVFARIQDELNEVFRQ